jgi:hypothetical protein
MYSKIALLLAAISTAQNINVYSGKDDGLSQHTVYMPTDVKGKVPVLIWASGGCAREGNEFLYLPVPEAIFVLCFGASLLTQDVGGGMHGPALREATSHGNMIIAMGLLGGGGKGPKTPKGEGLELQSVCLSPLTVLDAESAGKRPGFLQRRQGKGGRGPSIQPTSPLHEEAFAWLEKNAGKGKYANVDKSRVAIAGMSCGGLEA